MIKVVLDVNVILSGLIRPEGPPGELLARWDRGDFELVVSPTLIAELRRVMTYPRIAERIDSASAASFIQLVDEVGHAVPDSEGQPIRSVDPNDDYLIALVLRADAALVSGDRHLTDLRGTIPVFSPAEFLDYLAAA